MQFAPGTVIPAGFTIAFQSWENDGDHYHVSTMMGLEKGEVDYLIKIAPLFASKHNRKFRGYGNSDFNESIVYDIIERTLECEREMMEKFFSIRVPEGFASKEEPAELCSFDKYEVMEAFHDIVDYPVEYDHDFVRVLDNVKVYEFANEFVIPKLPEPLENIDI